VCIDVHRLAFVDIRPERWRPARFLWRLALICIDWHLSRSLAPGAQAFPIREWRPRGDKFCGLRNIA
jgi:hypothetical protein